MLLILCVAVLAVVDTTFGACKNDGVNNSRARRCPVNQHFESCATACPLTCDNYKDSTSVCTASCQPGCTCDDGFVQNRKGQCIRREQCFDNPPVCPSNSHYDPCGTPCPKTCANKNDPPGVCATVCNPSCQCDDGYIKDRNRQCVKPERCPVQAQPQSRVAACGPNQRYNDCGTACPRTCANYDDPDNACVERCVSGCECVDGYVISPDGGCVTPENCPRCPRHQHYESCGTACPVTCDNYKNPPQICSDECISGCACDNGYARTRDGDCIVPDMCPNNSPACRSDQHYESCASPCRLTCDNYKDQPVDCPDKFCSPGCICNDGLVETRNGQCVRREQCFDNPPVCPSNSHYDSCGTPCPKTCANLNDPPGGCATVCNPSCQCDDGYIKDRNRQCVKPENCPARIKNAAVRGCPANQHFESCASGCPLTCDNYMNSTFVCTKNCQPGCTCDDGFVRNGDGQCISTEQCPPYNCPLNEEPSTCVSRCNTCRQRDNCNYKCYNGCDCKKGFYRNPKGRCIPERFCPAMNR